MSKFDNKKIVLILEEYNFSKEVINNLSKDFDVRLNLKNILAEEFYRVKIIFARLSISLDKQFLSNFKNLKIIIIPATGSSHVDKKYLLSKKIKLITLKGHTKFLNKITPTSEITLWHILSLRRKTIEASKSITKNINNHIDRESFIGSDLYKVDIGIIGMGRLGKMMAKILYAMGANIYYTDIKKIKCSTKYRQLNLEKLLKRCEIVTIHVDHNDTTNNLISKKELDLMKTNACLVNTSRGGIIKEDELINHLIKNINFKVGLDVFEYEHLKNKNTENNFNKLKEFSKNSSKQITITPHIGGASINAMKLTEEYCYEELKKLNIDFK